MKQRNSFIWSIIAVAAVAIAIFLSGCKSTEPVHVPIHDSETTETTETITDDVTWTSPDSLMWWFIIECDENYNALLKEYQALNTGIESSIEVKEVVKWKTDKTQTKQLQVNITALIDSLALKDRTIEKLRKTQKVEQVPYPVPGPEVKVIPGYHKICAVIAPLLLLLILFAVYRKVTGKKFLTFP